MVSERGSVGDQKRLFWRVKEPLSETSVAKTQVIVGYFQETELQLVDNQHLINGVWDVGFLFENPRRQETRNYINVSSTNSEKKEKNKRYPFGMQKATFYQAKA